jgi:hypothetical protein
MVLLQPRKGPIVWRRRWVGHEPTGRMLIDFYAEREPHSSPIHLKDGYVGFRTYAGTGDRMGKTDPRFEAAPFQRRISALLTPQRRARRLTNTPDTRA